MAPATVLSREPRLTSLPREYLKHRWNFNPHGSATAKCKSLKACLPADRGALHRTSRDECRYWTRLTFYRHQAKPTHKTLSYPTSLIRYRHKNITESRGIFFKSCHQKLVMTNYNDLLRCLLAKRLTGEKRLRFLTNP